MRNVTQLKSLKDLRTPISARVRSTPRLKGSTYLEVFLLNKERERLETELTNLRKRQQRVERRIEEGSQAITELLSKAQGRILSAFPPEEPTNVKNPLLEDGHYRKWNRMTLGY